MTQCTLKCSSQIIQRRSSNDRPTNVGLKNDYIVLLLSVSAIRGCADNGLFHCKNHVMLSKTTNLRSQSKFIIQREIFFICVSQMSKPRLRPKVIPKRFVRCISGHLKATFAKLQTLPMQQYNTRDTRTLRIA